MRDILNLYNQDLALKGFSANTIKNYMDNIKRFLIYCNRPVNKINCKIIKEYLFHLIEHRKLANETIRIAYSAIKFLFCTTLKRPWEIETIPQIKKEKKLPIFLSFEEVFKIINNAANLKHKTLLMLIYSSGLRVSEATKIILQDIIRYKMRIKVKQAKGRKYRLTLLSHICLKYLEKYWKTYRPEVWLFPGINPANPISVRACQHAFHIAKKNAGINKKCGIHSLRHSFATHTLETGGGIFQLQKLLGHKNLKTTLVYVHLQEENILIKSPLDVYGQNKDC